MSEGILSQAEIDALLKGNDFVEENNDTVITEMGKDALGEVANISMGTAATTLSTLLGKKVEITTPKVELTSREKLKEDYPKPYVVINVKYTSGVKGHNILIMNINDALVISDLMMGGTGENPSNELSELHLSAISEAMNQMMGSASTSMATVLDRRINISPPLLDVIDLQNQDIGLEEEGSEPIVKIAFKMTIQGLLDSELMQLIPYNFAKSMLEELFKNYNSQTENLIPTQEYMEPPVEEYPNFSPNEDIPIEKEVAKEPSVTVKTVNFDQLSPQAPVKMPENLDLILDVPLQVSVELGRTNKTIKEILDFSTGSIIELNKLAGEPVDMLVNGKLFAKGEVVVIEENFGVRITDIISPLERVKNLQ
ncbi:MAG: flagellar motor switch phosphatase FliY [Peptococcales bacterium]|jgi:flagellar motor switch protein FliN/FliY